MHDDLISREAVRNIVNDIRDCISVEGYWAILERLKKLSPVNPTKTGWIPVSERLPEESLNSVIGWDAYRERCVFVQYIDGYFQITGSAESFDIVAWMPLPKPYEPKESEDKDADKKCTYKETGCGSCKRQLDCPIEADTSESEDRCKNCEYSHNPDYTRCHECKAESEADT